MLKKKNIEKEDALKSWENPKNRVLLQSMFGTFENYWKEVSEFNMLSSDEKQKKIDMAVKQIKFMKTRLALKRAGLIIK